MKMKKWMGIFLIGISLIIAGCSAEQPKAGVVDRARIATESKVGAEMQEKLQAQIKIIGEEMDKEPPKTQEESMAQYQEFQKRVQTVNQQLSREFQVNVEKAAADVAQEKKMGVILYKDTVAAGSIDITDDVIAKLGGKVEPKAEGDESASGEEKETPKQ